MIKFYLNNSNLNYFLNNLNEFLNLTELSISNCNINIIPNNLINLKKLKIINCYNIKEIPDTFINLQFLYIINCINIKTIPSFNHLILLKLNHDIDNNIKIKPNCRFLDY